TGSRTANLPPASTGRRLWSMSGLRIALAGPERINDLEPIYRALYAHHVAVSTWRPAPERGPDVAWSRRRRRYEQTLASPRGLLVVAERDRRMVGALVGEVDEEPGGSDTFAVRERVAHVHDL